MTSETADFFDDHAQVYDRLRPQSDSWWACFEALVKHGELRGRCVLDVGCGTGALAAALVERAGSKVSGTEQSAAMAAVARARVPPTVKITVGCAESLPYDEGTFERVVFSLVVHLIDRGAAFSEAHRVLETDGRLVISTFTHAHFDDWWASTFFPSLGEIDRARFPTERQLENELQVAGFNAISAHPLRTQESIPYDAAIAKLRGRHISTFALLDADEVLEGIARAEHELPERVDTILDRLIVVARR